MTRQQDSEFLISQYADGALEPEQAKKVEALLASDPHYRRLLQQHRALRESLNDWASRIPMVDWDAFHDRLSARLERVKARPALQRHWMRGIAAAAAIAMVATIFAITERQRDAVWVSSPVSINSNNGQASVNVQNPAGSSSAAPSDSGAVATVTVHSHPDSGDAQVTFISVHRDTFDAMAQHAGNNEIQQRLSGTAMDNSGSSASGSVSAMADFSSDNKPNVHP